MLTYRLNAVASCLCLSVLAMLTPARADTDRIGFSLSGSWLASAQTGSSGECKEQCRKRKDCSGYTFFLDGPAGKIVLGGKLDETGGREPNCAMLTGVLNESAEPGATSCRMPCDGSESAFIQPDEIGQRPLQPLDPAVTQAGSDGESATIKNGELTVRPDKPGREIEMNEVAVVVPDVPADPPPVPALSQVPVPITGYEVVAGPDVAIPPLGWAEATATCPSGKVAISGGYVMTAADPNVLFGLEIKGVMPDGNFGIGNQVKALFRNADTGQSGTGHAIAVCFNRPPGMSNRNNSVYPASESCGADQDLIGGGTWVDASQYVTSLHPVEIGRSGTNSWTATLTATPTIHERVSSRAICVPRGTVEGILHRTSPWYGLSGRTAVILQERCPAGKVALSGGFASRTFGADDIAALFGTLEPSGDGARWSAEMRNRDLFGGPDSVQGQLSIVCATAQ